MRRSCKNMLGIVSIFLATLFATTGTLSQLHNLGLVEASNFVNIQASRNFTNVPGEEIVSSRTENSKKYYLGNNSYSLNVSISAIHYKDNYSNSQETWKDIDLTIVNGRIDKAPYTLSINQDEKSFTIKDKKTGKTSTIKLVKISDIAMNSIEKKPVILSKGEIHWNDIVTGMDIAIVAENSRARFDWVVKNENAPHEVQFEVTDGGIPIIYKGADADGMAVNVIVQKSGNIVTERIEKGGKYPKIINPIVDLQVGASTDDATLVYYGYQWTFDSGFASNIIGYGAWFNQQWGFGCRFTGITIPAASTISAALLYLKSEYDCSSGTVYAKITGNKETNPATFSTKADYQARRGTIVGGADNTKITTAQVDWNDVGSWTANTWYTSPDIASVVQELIDYHAPSNESLVLFCDDYDDRSTHTYNSWRMSYSYDNNSSYAPMLWIFYYPPPPAAPTNVEASDNYYNGEVYIKWTLSSGATSYKVYRNTTNNSGTATQIGTPNSCQFDDTTATAGTLYYYWVKATNEGGDSGFSSSDTGQRSTSLRKYQCIAVTSDFPTYKQDVWNFVGILSNTAGYNIVAVSPDDPNNPQVWCDRTWWEEESANGNDDDYADNAEISILGAHGDNGRIVFPGGAWIDHTTVRLGLESESSTGDGYSKWWFITACNVLNDNSTGDWCDVMQGVHMILGFNSECVDQPGDMWELASRLVGINGFDKENIRDAFFHTYVVQDGTHDNNWARILAETSGVYLNDWIDSVSYHIDVDGTKSMYDCYF